MRSKGLTIIELLVTILIIGIVISVASLSVNNNKQQRVKEDTKTLYGLLRLAKEEAILNNREIIFEIDKKGYRFKLQSGDRFVDMRLPVFRPREFASYLAPVISVDESNIKLTAENKTKGGDIYFLSSGEITPFKIELHAINGIYEITGTEQGDIAMSFHGSD